MMIDNSSKKTQVPAKQAQGIRAAGSLVAIMIVTCGYAALSSVTAEHSFTMFLPSTSYYLAETAPGSDPAADLAAAALASANAESEKTASENIMLPAADIPVSDIPSDAPIPIMPESDMKAAEASATPVAPAPDVATPALETTTVETTVKTETAGTETKPAAPAVSEADLPPPPQEPSKEQVAAPAATIAPAVSPTVETATGSVGGQVTSTVAAPEKPVVDPMAPRPAVIRALPEEYLTVKKTHEAGDVDSRLKSARQSLARGNNQAALQLFNELSRDYPKDGRVLMGRAVALQRLGQTGQAIASYEAVLNANPTNLEALTNMLGLIKIENPALANEKLISLRDTYPDNADITAQLALSYAAMGNYEDALRYLDVAEALMPGSANILYNKAVLYDKMGRNIQAGELYRQVLRMSDEDSDAQGFDREVIKRRLSTLR